MVRHYHCENEDGDNICESYLKIRCIALYEEFGQDIENRGLPPFLIESVAFS